MSSSKKQEDLDIDDAMALNGVVPESNDSSQKSSPVCELSKQAEIVKNSLLQNIRIVNSSSTKFIDSYIGIASLLNSFKKHKDTFDGGEGKTGLTFNEELLKFSTKKYREIYSLKKFNSFFHSTVDSEPVPLIYDPNLDFGIYDKEAEIYKNNYISVKAKPDLNTNEKFILTFTGRKLTLVKNSLGFSITKQIGTNDVYKMNVGEMLNVYKPTTIMDNRKFVNNDPNYKKCMQEILGMKKELSEKTTEYNELVKKVNQELDQIKERGPNSISFIKQKIDQIKQDYQPKIKKEKKEDAKTILKKEMSDLIKKQAGTLKSQLEEFNRKVDEYKSKIDESNQNITSLKEKIDEKLKECNIDSGNSETKEMKKADEPMPDFCNAPVVSADASVGTEIPTSDTGINTETTTSDTGVGTDTKTSDTGVGTDTKTSDTGVGTDTKTSDTGVGTDTKTSDTGAGTERKQLTYDEAIEEASKRSEQCKKTIDTYKKLVLKLTDNDVTLTPEQKSEIINKLEKLHEEIGKFCQVYMEKVWSREDLEKKSQKENTYSESKTFAPQQQLTVTSPQQQPIIQNFTTPPGSQDQGNAMMMAFMQQQMQFQQRQQEIEERRDREEREEKRRIEREKQEREERLLLEDRRHQEEIERRREEGREAEAKRLEEQRREREQERKREEQDILRKEQERKQERERRDERNQRALELELEKAKIEAEKEKAFWK